MFSISALPPEGAFQMSIHFKHLWPFGQKSYIHILEYDLVIKYNYNDILLPTGEYDKWDTTLAAKQDSIIGPGPRL